MNTPQVRTIRHYLWHSPKQYVMIQANVVRSHIVISAENNKPLQYHDELQMTKEQAESALAKHRMTFSSTDRQEIHQNSTQVFYVPSKRK